MSIIPPDRTFTFNQLINSQYINDLYEGDYIMIEETFADVLKEYDNFLQNINTCYQAEDVPAFKSAVHKIKPLCGYVGLTGLQSRCQSFEDNCAGEGVVFRSLEKEAVDLIDHLRQAKSIIAEEKARLTQFNNQ
ncbi:MAG TPA: Hpt domain-containing protein [Puia sp.]|jgi:HPt (histidine-containing phosphotransfer) domain-containing protein